MVKDWNPHVNSEFNLEGGYGLEDGYLETLKFESGGERIFLKNSYVPMKYTVSLYLDNQIPVNEGRTEYGEFARWFAVSLRYGTLPFRVLRIGYKRGAYIKTGEIGVYQFVPNSLRYDAVDGLVLASFEIKELSYSPEVAYAFLATQNGEILLTGSGNQIIALGG
jgi:hypothetical protein